MCSWRLCKTSEQVCKEAESNGRYKSRYIWETIYMDPFWQVQRRHCLNETNRSYAVMPMHLDPFTEDLPGICSCKSNICVLCTELPFRIQATCGPYSIIVAMALSSESIMQQFLRYLTQNVSPLLNILLGDSTSDKSSIEEHQFHFITLKIRALIERQDLEDREVAPDTSREQLTSHTTSPVYPEDIEFQTNCAIWIDRYFRGTIYFTQQQLYFVSLAGEYTLELNFTDIIRFHLDTLQLFQEECISFSTNCFIEYHLFEVDVDEILCIMRRLWKQNVRFYHKPKRKSFSTTKHGSLSNITDNMVLDCLPSPFHSNPFTPTLLEERTIISIFLNHNSGENENAFREMEGSIELSFHGFYFYNGADFSIVVPFAEAESINRSRSGNSGEKLVVVLRSTPQRLEFMMPSLEFLGTIFQLFQLSTFDEIEPTLLHPVDVDGDLSPAGELSPAPPSKYRRLQLFRSGEKRSLYNWNFFFSKFGCSSALSRCSRLADLIRSGIPHQYRGFIWRFSCGSMYHKYQKLRGYQYYLTEYPDVYRPAEVLNQIERDLDRTLPQHPLFVPKVGAKLSALRNVLVAYSNKNANIGYCQGMNVICAFLLLYLNEEEAFYCLGVICEKVVPGYYQKDLSGILLDQQVMDILMKKYLPEISTHIQVRLGGALLVCFEWFMCFFARCLPMKLAIRVFDWVLLDGARALFVVSLAVLKYLEGDILSISHATDLLDKVKHNMLQEISYDSLFQIMLYFNDILSNEEIDKYREDLSHELNRDCSHTITPPLNSSPVRLVNDLRPIKPDSS